MYCEKCRNLIEGRNCPDCGPKRVREVREDDLCFVIEKPQMWGEMLEDVFRQNDVPYIVQRTMGAGLAMSIGAFLECYRFYVPYSDIKRAEELLAELFPVEAGLDWTPVEQEREE